MSIMNSAAIGLLTAISGLLYQVPLVATDQTTSFVRVSNPTFSTEGSTSFNADSRMHCAATCSRNKATCDIFRYFRESKECHHLTIAIGTGSNFPSGQVTYSDTETFYAPSLLLTSVSLCPSGWGWMGYKCYMVDFTLKRISQSSAVTTCAALTPGGGLMQVKTPQQLNLIHKYLLGRKQASSLKYTWVSGRRVAPGTSIAEFTYDDGTAIPLDSGLWFGTEPFNKAGNEDVIDLLYKPDSPLTPNFGLNDENAASVAQANYICEVDAQP